MKKKLILACTALLSVGAILASCGGEKPDDPNDGGDKPGPVEITLKDNREEVFTAVSGEIGENGEFVADGDETNFKSLYEAANYLYENCEYGSYVKLKTDTTGARLFEKRSSEESAKGERTDDQWFYYANGTQLNGYSKYLTGDVEFFRDEKVSRIMVSSDGLKQSYQPYHLLGRTNGSTQAWNLLPFLDTSIRYNPIAFSGMRSITYNFDLSAAKIRPSYSTIQKAVPMITLSQTDSYNWSNQGIYMDTDTGNWYYLKGETQSDVKELEYDDKEVILTSSWDQEKQEFTPNGDVEMTLNYVYNETDEIWTNDLIIKTTVDGKVTEFKKNYEYINMNGRGTPRANISLDLISDSDEYDEGTIAPDFMCGAYFKNITVTDAYGKVPEGLTDEDYQGDSIMVGEAGKTYDLLNCDEKNDMDLEVILEHYDAITHHSDITDKDVFDISYEPVITAQTRTDAVVEVENLIKAIEADANATSPSVIKANSKYSKLLGVTQSMIKSIDRLTALEDALNRG